MIEIQLFLTDDPASVMEQLKAAGLQVSQIRATEKVIAGRLPLDKLIELLRVASVKFVAPVRR